MQVLIEKEKKSVTTKPDFNRKTGRELWAAYLISKFRQIFEYDRQSQTPIIKEVNSNFTKKFLKRLIDNPKKHILVAITGASASGKSTICSHINKMTNQLNMPVTIMSSDNYFNDISDLIKIYGDFDSLRDKGYDVDSPKSFQMSLLREDLEKLACGKDIKMPHYLLNGTGISIPNAIPVESKKIIVVEGMATLYDEVKDLFDVKIFVDVDEKIQEKWFLDRAITRNQDRENAIKHLNYARKAYHKYIEPSKKEADIIINANAQLNYFCSIIEYIYTITNNCR